LIGLAMVSRRQLRIRGELIAGMLVALVYGVVLWFAK
jgi:hypothetical protein